MVPFLRTVCCYFLQSILAMFFIIVPSIELIWRLFHYKSLLETLLYFVTYLFSVFVGWKLLHRPGRLS